MENMFEWPSPSCALFQKFVALVEACGPAECAMSKHSVTFQGAMRGFAGARSTTEGLVGYLALPRTVLDPRFDRASPYTRKLVVHHFQVSAPDELDEVFAMWIREAYAIGARAQVT